MLERWEFIQFPCTKDAQRYKLKVKADEEDLHKILKMLSSNAGRPFASLSKDYNWGVYFYGVDEAEKNRIIESLKHICSQGSISQSDITMEQELSPIFEEFLEATAKDLSGDEDRKKSKNKKTIENEEEGNKSADNEGGIKPGIDYDIFQSEYKTNPDEEKVEGIQPGVSRDIFGSNNLAEAGKESFEMQGFDLTENAPAFNGKENEEKHPSAITPDININNETRVNAAIDDVKLSLNPKYTMDEFVVGSNNRFTHAAAKAVAENPGKIYNPLFIYGGVGLGKTHLMHAVGHFVMGKDASVSVMYITTEKFMSEVIESIGRGTLQEFREKYRKVDLMLIDDIQFLSESESTQEEFFHTFNMLHENNKQIIITSDRPPKQLTTLEDRLRSRFEWGLIADIKSPSLETRVAILKKKNENSQINLKENMLLYIASKLKSNVRELEGFLKRINAYASLTGQDVTLDLVKSVMRELLPEEELDEEIEASDSEKPEQESAPSTVEEKLPRPAAEKSVVDDVRKPLVQETSAPSAPPPPATAVPAASAPQKPVPPKMPLPGKPSPPAAPKPIKPGSADPSQPTMNSGIGDMSRDEVDPNLVPVEVAFFFPEGKNDEFNIMREKFRQVIKKHKLKFRFESVFERSYDYNSKINYAFFTELCKTNNVRIVVVLGAPENPNATSEDFCNLLTAMMDDEKISMQYVPWNELNKDFRYLNLALDITLLRNKKT